MGGYGVMVKPMAWPMAGAWAGLRRDGEADEAEQHQEDEDQEHPAEDSHAGTSAGRP
jgi:ribosomal protein L12E/L44/L45/RPP1/RPP2